MELWVKITLTMWVISLTPVVYNQAWQEIDSELVVRAVSICLLTSFISSILLIITLIWRM